MELEEFASLQLDKPLPDVRVCKDISMRFYFHIFILFICANFVRKSFSLLARTF